MYAWSEKLIETAEDKKLICGVEILLENKRNARKCLDEMTLKALLNLSGVNMTDIDRIKE